MNADEHFAFKLRRFTYPDVPYRSGGRGEYIDMRAMRLLEPGVVRGKLLAELRRASPKWQGFPLVATGTGGMALLTLLDMTGLPRLLWNPKSHGRSWSGFEPRAGVRVILLDDVATTGGTLDALREAVAIRGWKVFAEVVLVDRR